MLVRCAGSVRTAFAVCLRVGVYLCVCVFRSSCEESVCVCVFLWAIRVDGVMIRVRFAARRLE